MSNHGPITAEIWMADVFRAKAVRDGQVIRRKLRDIDRYVGRKVFLAELERRGYFAFENWGQLIIICNQDAIHQVV